MRSEKCEGKMQEEEGGREGKTEERREEGYKKTMLTTSNTAIHMD